MQWTEASIGRAIVRQLFQRAVLAIPNCGWTGHECDLLVIERGLRIIDVEVKISRADLKADLKKDKWWVPRPWSRWAMNPPAPLERREWPPKVWKHYYALPKEIWEPSLLEALPAASGVLLLYWQGGQTRIALERAAKPNREAQAISAVEAINLARLAGLRMWDALHRLDQPTRRKAIAE